MSFSQKKIYLSLALIILASLLGCGLKVSEKPYAQPPIKIEQNISCLDDIGEKFDQFFSAKMTDSEIVEFFMCAKRSLIEFKENSQGLKKGVYTPRELQRFLETYFVKKNKISEALLEEAMVIKKTMVGGTKDELTQGDLDRGVDLLEIVSSLALRLNKHMGVIVNGFDDTVAYEKGADPVENAIEVLNEVSTQIGVEFSKNQGDYSFLQLNRFLKEFRFFLNWGTSDEGDKKLQRVNDWVHFAKVFKGMLFAGDESVVKNLEWPKFLKEGFSWYGIYLRYKYHIKSKQILFGIGLQRLNSLVSDVVLSAKNIIFNTQKKMVYYKDLYKIIYAMEDLGIVPFNIQAKSLEGNLEVYINRGFGNIEKPYLLRKSEGVTLEHIRNMEYEYGLWSSVQEFLDRNTNSDGKVSIPNEVATVNYLKCFNSKGPSRYVDPRCEIMRLLYQRPMFEQPVNSIYLNYSSSRSWQNPLFVNLSRMNVIRASARLLILAYGEHTNAVEKLRVLNQEGIKISEFEQFYSDAKPLGVDLKVMHPDNVKVGERSFKEGRMFTYSGKGCQLDEIGELVTYEELIELISIVYSGGNLARKGYSFLLEKCGPADTNRLGVHGNPMIDFYCYRDNYRDLLSSTLGTMPGLKLFLENLSNEEFAKYHQALFKAYFNVKKYNFRYIELSDLMTMYTIIHYIEIAVTRYDINQDGVLDFYELNTMYDTFKGLFLSIAPDKKYAKMGFFYTILTGKVPTQSSIIHPMKIQIIQDIPNWFFGESEAEALNNNSFDNITSDIKEMKIDRLGVAKAFSIVAQSMRAEAAEKNEKQLPDVCE